MPTLSLLDWGSLCRPQALCGFSRVMGSGQACPCPGQGVAALGGSGPASLCLPRGQNLQQPAKAGLLGSASPQGAQDTGSLCLGPPTARVPLQPHRPYACPKPVLSPPGAGAACKTTRVAGLGPSAGLPGSSGKIPGADEAAPKATEALRVTPGGEAVALSVPPICAWSDGSTRNAMWVLQACLAP